MRFHSCTLQNQLYACTVVTLLILLSLQFSLFRWIQRKPPVHFLITRETTKPIQPFLPFVLNPARACSSHPYLLIFVASSSGNLERRRAIRQTWAQQLSLEQSSAAVLFLLGRGTQPDAQKTITEEFFQHGDIIQGDFIDAYNNLTLKSVLALKWTVRYCPTTQFVMKTDDDIFVNVPYLADFLYSQRNQSIVIGCRKGHVGAPLMKMADGTMGKGASILGGHPPFLAGAGYVVAGPLVPKLYEAARSLKVFPIEDVFITAHCARKAGARLVHDRRFSCGEAFRDDCTMSQKFTGHWVSPERQLKLWDKLRRGDCGMR